MDARAVQCSRCWSARSRVRASEVSVGSIILYEIILNDGMDEGSLSRGKAGRKSIEGSKKEQTQEWQGVFVLYYAMLCSGRLWIK